VGVIASSHTQVRTESPDDVLVELHIPQGRVRLSGAGTPPTAEHPGGDMERQGDDMPARRRLTGRTIAAPAADGFEKVELTIPLEALKAAGARVDVVSLRRGRIRGVNLHMPASRVRVDETIGRADPGDYDGLLVPGGFIDPDLLRQSAPAREFVRAFAASGEPIASLCHGPWVLASAGLLDGPSPPGPGSATIW
jgi:hypothetical protein